MQAKEVRICPKCKSKDVKVSTLFGTQSAIRQTPEYYHCNDCGYDGYMPIILVKK